MNTDKTLVVRIVFVLLLAGLALLALFTGTSRAPQEAFQSGAEGLQESMAVQVPEIVNLAIQLGITALVVAGANWVFNLFGLDLRGTAAGLAVTISAYVIAELQNIVNLTPPNFDLALSTLFYVLSLVLAPIGALALWRGRGASPPTTNGDNSLL